MSQTFDVGNATGSNSSDQYPSPFGRYYYGSRHQFVYTVAELQAAGLSAATAFDSLGFNVTAVNTADNHARFTIRMGNVANANLDAGWIDTTVLTRVFRINFGQFSNGATTSARLVTVKNLAGGGLVINGASIGGIDAARFGLVDTNTYPKILGVNDSLRFGVTFSPIAAQSYSAVVNITHSGSITETVSLSGAGIDAFVVSNNNDAGDGSLRQVLETVNKAGGNQLIQFLTTGDINLQSNLPTITANVNIVARSWRTVPRFATTPEHQEAAAFSVPEA